MTRTRRIALAALVGLGVAVALPGCTSSGDVDVDGIVNAALAAIDKIAVRGKLSAEDVAFVPGTAEGDRILNGALLGQIKDITGPKVWSLFADNCVIGEPITAAMAAATHITNDSAGDIAFKSACSEIIKAVTHAGLN